MAGVLAKILPFPIINLWGWANGNEYMIEDDSTVLTPELAESDKKTDEDYNKHFKTPNKKENGGKGKSQYKVEKSQLNAEKTTDLARVLETNEKEREGR